MIKEQIESTAPFRQNQLMLNIGAATFQTKVYWILNNCLTTIIHDKAFVCVRCHGKKSKSMTDAYYMQCTQCKLMYRVTGYLKSNLSIH